jgi:membrane-associated protease RseP (regulator of RpoE activity)
MFSYILGRLWSYVVALLILGLVFVIHESSHWIAAEICGVHAQSFNIGMGPGVKIFELFHTDIYLRFIPFSASVELPLDPLRASVKGLADLSTIQKLFVFGAGIFTNILTGQAALWYCSRDLESIFANIRLMLPDQKLHRQSRLKSKTLNFLASAADLFAIFPTAARPSLRSILLSFGTLSVPLGIANLLPIPPLDGARIFDALFVGGVLSAGRPAATVTTFELSAILVGLVLIAGPIFFGFIPAAIRRFKYERALYKISQEKSADAKGAD